MTFFKTGEDVLKLERDPETGRAMPRNNRGLGFTDNLWGNKAREFVKTTTQLTVEHWGEIVEHTASFMNTTTLDSEDESNNNVNAEAESPNPRAVIDLDWCVHYFIYPFKGYSECRILNRKTFISLCASELEVCGVR